MQHLDQAIEQVLPDVIGLRRRIHAHPELAREEHETSRLVQQELHRLGLETKILYHTGVVAVQTGRAPGKTLLLRADMDALPIQEDNDLDFKSTREGLMHACGHDVHTAMLLGAAKVLSQLGDEFVGQIKYVFQPAEEDNPRGGARDMIEQGVLEDPAVDAAMALHIWDLPVGSVGIRRGVMMAQSDRLTIKVRGQSAHAAQPNNGRDAIVAAAQIVSALQTVVARNVDPMESAVITLGTISGGSRYNVLSDYVEMNGTIRTFRSEVARLVAEQVKQVAERVAEGLGCRAEVIIGTGYAATINDARLADQMITALQQGLGQDKVLIPQHPSSGGEDFSLFTQAVPSVYAWLGISSDLNEGRRSLHNPRLLIDEDCIATGIKVLVLAALDYLSPEKAQAGL